MSLLHSDNSFPISALPVLLPCLVALSHCFSLVGGKMERIAISRKKEPWDIKWPWGTDPLFHEEWLSAEENRCSQALHSLVWPSAYRNVAAPWSAALLCSFCSTVSVALPEDLQMLTASPDASLCSQISSYLIS